MTKPVTKISFILCCTIFLFSISAIAGPVPDTGQTLCYDDIGNVITCPLPGQPFYGQDAQYGNNLQSLPTLETELYGTM